MFARLARIVVHHPWRVIATWVVVAAALVAFAPRLADIQSSDQSSFLPHSYESVQATRLAEQAFPQQQGGTSAIVVVKRSDGTRLSSADQQRVRDLAARLRTSRIDKVTGALTTPQSVSPNKAVQLVSVEFSGTPQDKKVLAAVAAVRSQTATALGGSELTAGVTGQAAIMLDNQDAFANAERIVGIATIVLILVLLLVMFRSPVAALFPIFSVGLVYTLSSSVIALAGKILGFHVSDFLTTLLTVVMFGIGTDYILFLLFRFRERLRAGDDPREAMVTAVSRVGEAIASAAASVIIAFAALGLSSFGAFRTLGPSLAIAVFTMLVAALTLIPAIVVLLGPRVFWPSKGWRSVPESSLGRRAGRLVSRRPGLTALASGGLLVLLGAGVAGYAANYDQIGQLPKNTESARAFTALQTGFPAGALNPTQVYVTSGVGSPLPAGAADRVVTAVQHAPGVGAVQAVQPSRDRRTTQITVLLRESPFTNRALDAVAAGGPVRTVAHRAAPSGTSVLVGGQSSALADVRQATNSDLKLIFPVAGALILLVLMLLLRSLVAPFYLLASVVLVFLGTLGATVFAYLGIGSETGLMFMLPIIVYLFVVAIGTDYNILMIARLREEARAGNDPRTAVDLAIEHAGPSVASAAVILAGTFASLVLAGISLLTQMGFAVAIGILLSAFVVSTLFVPSITALVGHAAWWPGHEDRGPREAVEPAPVREPVA